MTQRELIAALEEECRTDRTKVEDFLGALNDLFVEVLQRGERFSLPFGWIFAAPRKERGATRAMIHFKASPDLRAALKIPGLKFPAEDFAEGDICPTCRVNPIQKSKECSTCLYRAWMQRNGHVVKPRKKRAA